VSGLATLPTGSEKVDITGPVVALLVIAGLRGGFLGTIGTGLEIMEEYAASTLGGPAVSLVTVLGRLFVGSLLLALTVGRVA
jgi:hypothetical protein